MSVKPIPEGFHTVTPYIMVHGAKKYMEFLEKAFDAKINSVFENNGSVMNAEVRIGSSLIMVGDVPEGHKPSDAMYYVYVPDADALFKQAVAAGAESLYEPMDQFYGDRSGAVKDTSGNVWWIATHVKDISEEELKKLAAEQKDVK